MIWSMIWAGVTAWLSGIILVITVGQKWPSYLEATASYVVCPKFMFFSAFTALLMLIQTWFIDVLDSTYGGGIWCALILIGLNSMLIVNIYTAGSRITWSMARDRALPFSEYFSVVNKQCSIPLRALMAFIVLNILTGTLVLGSELAFYAIISGGGIALQVSYCVPVLCVVLRGRDKLPPRPHFDLGRWGYTINIVSLLWSIIVTLFYVFPQAEPVVGNIANMNWSIVILAGVFVFGAVYWFLKGRKEYLFFGNSVLEENVVVDGEVVKSGQDALTSFGKH